MKEATVGNNISSSVQFEVRPANYETMARIAKAALTKCPVECPPCPRNVKSGQNCTKHIGQNCEMLSKS